jgi:hypothetical protein
MFSGAAAESLAGCATVASCQSPPTEQPTALSTEPVAVAVIYATLQLQSLHAFTCPDQS